MMRNCVMETQNVILGKGSALLEVQCLGIRCGYSILVPVLQLWEHHNLANMTLYNLHSIPDAPLTATASTSGDKSPADCE